MVDSQYTVFERVRRDVFNTCKSVRQLNGHNTDLEVEWFNRLGNTPGDDKGVLKEESPTLRDDAPYMHHAWDVPFVLTCYVQESESSNRTATERINLLMAYVHKALMVDPHRNGVAVDTFIDNPNVFPDADPPGVDIVFRVHVRTLKTDPYSQ